jgi:hypothetical protein
MKSYTLAYHGVIPKVFMKFVEKKGATNGFRITTAILIFTLLAHSDPLSANETEGSLMTENPSLDNGYSTRLAMTLSLSTTFGLLGLGGTFVGIGIAVDSPGAIATGSIIGILGLIIGPSIGHSYLKNYNQAILTSMARSALFLLAGGMLIALVERNVVGEIDDETDVTLIVISCSAAAGILALDLYDFLTIPSAARKANEELKNRRVSLTFAPIITTRGDSRSVIGLGVVGKF